jgi:hypothetical protein
MDKHLKDREKCRQVSIISLISQADVSELERIEAEINSGLLSLDAEFTKLALKLIKKMKKNQ